MLNMTKKLNKKRIFQSPCAMAFTIILSLQLVSSIEFGYDYLDHGNSTTYNNITNNYNNYTSNISTLNDISDVQVPTPSDGEVLTWSASLGKWIASAISTATNWFIDDTNGYLSNDTDTIYFNEGKLNETILKLAPTAASGDIYYEYLTNSRYDTVIENLSDSDQAIVNEVVQPGEHYVYGEYLV